MFIRRLTTTLLAACVFAAPACDGGRTEPDPPATETPTTQPSEPRNPFGLEDVPDCCGAESQAFAEQRRK